MKMIRKFPENKNGNAGFGCPSAGKLQWKAPACNAVKGVALGSCGRGQPEATKSLIPAKRYRGPRPMKFDKDKWIGNIVEEPLDLFRLSLLFFSPFFNDCPGG